MKTSSVAAVVVTHNRLAMLKENIAALRNQTRKVNEIIVVNNGSTDGTNEWLAAQADLTAIPQEDIGAGGGQCVGIKAAYSRGHDWFWSMDDDAIPDADALEQLLKCPKADDDQTGFLCSYVRWTDGSLCLMTIPNVHPDYQSLMELLPLGLLRMTVTSFISILSHRRAIAKAGLPLREMFVWFGDVEFSLRISSHFLCYQVLASKVEHRSKTNRRVDFDNMASLPVDYLQDGLRNFIFLCKRNAQSKAAGWFDAIMWALRLQRKVWRQFSGANRRKLAWAVCRGFFFNPKIEMPD